VPDENLEEVTDANSNAGSALRVYGPVCLQIPLYEHLIPPLLPEGTGRTSTETTHQLSKASVEGKQLQIKFRKSELLHGTPTIHNV
jgi:hypothetical protein